MKILNKVRTCAIAAVAALPLIAATPTYSQSVKHDSFEYSVPPSGTDKPSFLAKAPNPSVVIQGKKRNAAIVVDLSTNVLYKYNDKGKAEKAYRIASGKKSTPTHTGVRVVTHIETFPYRSAGPNTKRRRHPKDYGPKIICLNILDPKTGEQSPIGEFIHGNNNASSIGKYASHGCMRMDNEVIKQLVQEVKRGDIVLIK